MTLPFAFAGVDSAGISHSRQKCEMSGTLSILYRLYKDKTSEAMLIHIFLDPRSVPTGSYTCTAL